MSFTTESRIAVRRDLTKMVEQLRAFPSDAAFWETPPGISNSAGTLAVHIDGNLREFVGRQLGGVELHERSAGGVQRERGAERMSWSVRLSELCG